MKIIKSANPFIAYRILVEFAPNEENEFLNTYGKNGWRCLSMGPVKNYKTRKPWGLREALLERRVKVPKKMTADISKLLSRGGA